MNVAGRFKLALLAASLFLSSQAFAGKSNDTLVYASDSEPENISPYHNNLREGVIVAHMVWDTLIYRDPSTGQYKPELATAWKWESPTSLLVDLRRDVTFQNGDKFTADDVVFTFNYVVSPDSKVVTRQNVDWIKGAEKVGDYQVRILLKAPFPAALEYLSGPTPIYPAAYFKKVGLEGFSKAPVGTGPYKITTVTPGVGVTMVKHTGYFKDGPLGTPKIGTIGATDDRRGRLDLACPRRPGRLSQGDAEPERDRRRNDARRLSVNGRHRQLDPDFALQGRACAPGCQLRDQSRRACKRPGSRRQPASVRDLFPDPVRLR
jgi:hypothetical protein